MDFQGFFDDYFTRMLALTRMGPISELRKYRSLKTVLLLNLNGIPTFRILVYELNHKQGSYFFVKYSGMFLSNCQLCIIPEQPIWSAYYRGNNLQIVYG